MPHLPSAVTRQPPIPGTQPLAAELRYVECDRCHRALTDAESRLYGRGPVCRHQTPPEPRGWHIDQEQLPGL